MEVLGDDELIKHVTEFYKGLFGQFMETSSKLDGLECEQLSEEDMNFLKKL
jgi:hypothetical protein